MSRVASSKSTVRGLKHLAPRTLRSGLRRIVEIDGAWIETLLGAATTKTAKSHRRNRRCVD